MELKVLCNCGQKFKFDVEPVNGRMPFTVNCPVCGLDGTAAANTLLARNIAVSPSSSPPPLPPAVAPPVHRPAPATMSASMSSALHRYQPPATAAPAARAARAAKAPGGFNLGLGIVGALLGAGLGAAVMLAIAYWGKFRFPWMGVGIGFLTALGARILGKGGDQALGGIAAVVALGMVAGTLYVMYPDGFMDGGLAIANPVSIILGASVAYRVASK